MPSTIARSRRLTLLVAAAVCLLAGALGSPTVHAATRTTTWFTLNVSPPSTKAAGLYLSAGPNSTVSLQRYVSGAPHEQWAVVPPEWPGFSPVTGHGPAEGFLDCVGKSACDFHGQAGAPPVKLVNRLNGTCLTFATPTQVLLSRCKGSGPVAPKQTLAWDALGGDSTLQALTTTFRNSQSGPTRCLVASRLHNTVGTLLGAARCAGRGEPRWAQGFRLLEAGSATCDIGVTNNICGLPSWWRA
jgi:hypothetical protein